MIVYDVLKNWKWKNTRRAGWDIKYKNVNPVIAGSGRISYNQYEVVGDKFGSIKWTIECDGDIAIVGPDNEKVVTLDGSAVNTDYVLIAEINDGAVTLTCEGRGLLEEIICGGYLTPDSYIMC